MEIGQPMGGAQWTSTSPRPFRRAPGGGFAGTRWSSTSVAPFGPAPGAGRGLGYISGFHAAPADAETIQMDPLLVLGKGPFTIKKEPFIAGQIPSMVVRFQFTDRGGVSKGILDNQVKEFLRKAGLKVSTATSFKSVPVTWRWQLDPGGTFYYAIVQSPSNLAGLRYAGRAFGTDLVYEPSAALMAKLPTQMWIYTVATTTAQNTMSDADGARVITLLKQAMVNMADKNMQAYAHVLATVRSSPPEVFGGAAPKPVPPAPAPKPPAPVAVKQSAVALALLIAYNMLSPHIGSEVL